jgi:hypothetical protein
MKWMRRMVAAVGLAAFLAATAQAEMAGGLPIDSIAPDAEVTPLGGSPALLSQLQGQRVFALFIFKST